MDNQRWERVKELFDRALSVEQEELNTFWSTANPDELALRADVEALLEADSKTGEFMKPITLAGLSGQASADRWIGKRIGQYQLKKIISSGGMGTVFEALQEHPERTVAVKVMKESVVSETALRRFDFETRILASLTHPNIAQIIEAGTFQMEDDLGSGLPYFVMEYIPGASAITRYAVDEDLSPRRKAELFLQTCDAVHHGHQKGVIHRDLKPGNILVDSSGRVKVIDFGVARATDSDLTTLQTDVGQLIGTVQYMSPEQCSAVPEDLDIRSDVYALGVVLYELLCDNLPYDVNKTPVYEATRIIREEPPKRPSTTNRALRGDLETIVLKALEKDPTCRYQTVKELSEDLRRYLRGEIILARPAGPVTRMLKLAKRRPALAAATSVGLISLAVLLFYILFWSYPRILAENRRALEAEQEARKEADNARAINEFLETMIASPNPYEAGKDVMVLDILDGSADEIEEKFADKPEIRASLMMTLGWTYYHLGQGGKAEPLLRDSMDSYQHILGVDHPASLKVMNKLGILLNDEGRYAEAEECFRQVLEIRRRDLGDEHPDTLQMMNNLADLLSNQGLFTEAEAISRKELAIQRRILGDEHPSVLTSMNNLAIYLANQGKFPETVPLLQNVVDVRLRVLGEKHPSTLIAMSNLASMLAHTGSYDDAESLSLKVLEIRTDVLGKEHPRTLKSMNSVAGILSCQGKLVEAEALFRKTWEIRRRVRGEDHPESLHSKYNLASILSDLDRLAEAETLMREVLSDFEEHLGKRYSESLSTRIKLAFILEKRNAFTEAEALYRGVLESAVGVLSDDHLDWAWYRTAYGRFLLKMKRYAEAEVQLTEGYSRYESAYGASDEETLKVLTSIIELYEVSGKPETAEEWRRKKPDSNAAE